MASKKQINILSFIICVAMLSVATSVSASGRKVAIIMGTLCLPDKLLLQKKEQWIFANLSCQYPEDFEKQFSMLKTLPKENQPEVIVFIQDSGARIFYERFGFSSQASVSDIKLELFSRMWKSYWSLLLHPKKEQQIYLSLIQSKIDKLAEYCKQTSCRLAVEIPAKSIENQYFFRPLSSHSRLRTIFFTLLMPHLSFSMKNFLYDVTEGSNINIKKYFESEDAVDLSRDGMQVRNDQGYFSKLISDAIADPMILNQDGE